MGIPPFGYRAYLDYSSAAKHTTNMRRPKLDFVHFGEKLLRFGLIKQPQTVMWLVYLHVSC